MGIIDFNSVSFSYDKVHELAIDNVSFTVEAGEWLTIVGHNGSGKSTIAKLIMGLLTPEKGQIYVCGFSTSKETSWKAKIHIGIVFQNPDNQFVGATVQDDVAFALENYGVKRTEMIKRVRQALTKVHLENFLDEEPHNLSGGQKQRVAIAGVLAQQPAVIIFDEATSMLDPECRSEVYKIIDELRQSEALTVISITHDIEETLFADRLIVLNKGKIFAEGTPHQVFQNSSNLTDAGLELPFALRMSELIREHAPHINANVTMEELVNDICRLHSKK